MSRPAHCGVCDPVTRMVETDDDKAAHCPRCSPRATVSIPGLMARRDRLQTELDEVKRLIAAAETPEWARGPARPPP